MLRICKHHGSTEFREQSSNGKKSWYCVKCYRVRQNKLRIEKKERALAYMGGKCSSCGYDKCKQALEFHHIDPSTKDVDGEFRGWSWERIQGELDKCILLCSNCHKEAHYT